MINIKIDDQKLGIYIPNGGGGVSMDSTSSINLGWNLVVFDLSNYNFYVYPDF